MAGIVVTDLGGGDAYWSIVDDQLWQQILDVRNSLDEHDVSTYAEWVGYLSSGEPETAKPDRCPERSGKVLKACCTQNYVIEPVSASYFDSIQGILTLPGG